MSLVIDVAEFCTSALSKRVITSRARTNSCATSGALHCLRAKLIDEVTETSAAHMNRRCSSTGSPEKVSKGTSVIPLTISRADAYLLPTRTRSACAITACVGILCTSGICVGYYTTKLAENQ